MRPGHENLIAMSAVNTIADEAIRDVSPGKRNCYFQDEFQLEMYSLYSQSGCIFECKMRLGKARTVGGCTPWFYPSADTNMCDPWQTQTFLSAVLDGGAGQFSERFLTSDFSSLAKSCGHCLPDCVSTVYTSSVSATPLRRCDTKNIGLTYLCKFEGDVPLPAIWSHQVLSEYKKSYPEEDLPDFLRFTSFPSK